jgi:hypothetical protein
MPAITDSRAHSDSVRTAHPGPNDGPAVEVPSQWLMVGDREVDCCSSLHGTCPIRPQFASGLWERKQIP